MTPDIREKAERLASDIGNFVLKNGVPPLSLERLLSQALLEAHKAGRAEAMRHLGQVLYMFSDLHADDRCEAFEDAMNYYNAQNPDAMVQPVPDYETRLVHVTPLTRIATAIRSIT